MLDFKPHNARKAGDLAEATHACSRPVLEPKYDGWRMVVIIDKDGSVSLWSRNGKPYRLQCPEPIMDEFRGLPPDTILDGEMVDRTDNNNCIAVVNVFGKSKNKAFKFEQDKIHYVVFDCLKLGGDDITGSSLESRREQIEFLFSSLYEFDRIRLTPQAPAEPEYEAVILEQGFEGIMVKDLDSVYARGKRGYGWFKLKTTTEIDVVVMGMELDGKGQHSGKVGRFVVGQYIDGELIERVKVNPYDDKMRNDMTEAMSPSHVEADPLQNPFYGRVCTIKHYGILKDGLRHPVFVRWREDKPAEECGFDNG